jgi:hypothetical protein
LKWLRENGCPWNENTCINAAQIGNFKILKWARDNGCPWDEFTCPHGVSSDFHSIFLKWIERKESF